MKRILFLCAVFILFTVNAAAQKNKPWTEWSEKEAVKVMTDSAWAQTQKELTESDAASSGPAMSGSSVRRDQAAVEKNPESGESLGRKSMALTANYSMAFLTAKPVRQAFIRYLEINGPETPADKAAERRTFIDHDFGDYIVVTLKLEGNDEKKLRPGKQLLSGDPKIFKETAYLERKDGKRVALADYRPPDQFGAKFIFPRTLDGKPFLDAGSGEVRVNLEIGKTKLSRRFKVADMMYDGKLEY
jgi:hypothetical protein